MNEFIISFRETLEASLIIGIVLTYLNRYSMEELKRNVWYGLGAAIGASVLVAVVFTVLQKTVGGYGEAYEKLFEGLMMWLAAGFLAYMVIWMSKNTNIRKELEQSLQNDSTRKAVFALVFFAVLREGFETVLFLFASFQSTQSFSYIGFFAGILLAVLIGYQIFYLGKKVNVKKFFNFTSVLLILMAAGMVAYGTHEMEEFMEKMHWVEKEQIARPYDILKPTTEQPQSLLFYTQKGDKYYHWLHEKGAVGEFLKGLFGYNSNPNWIELVLWVVSLVAFFILWRQSVASVQKATAALPQST